MQLNFDASQVKPSEAGLEPIRFDGWVKAVIVESVEDKSAELDYQGQPVKLRLALKHQIIEGPFKDRIFYNGLNLRNPSAQAVEIAYRDLSAICHATGVIQCASSEQLHNRPMYVKIQFIPAGPDKQNVHRPDRNEVRGYKSVQAYEQQKAQEAASGGAAPAAAPAFVPPAAAAPAPAAQGWAPPAQAAAPAYAPPAAPAPAAAPWGGPQPAAAPQAPWQPPAQAPAPAAAQGWTPPPQNAGPQPPWAGGPAQQ